MARVIEEGHPGALDGSAELLYRAVKGRLVEVELGNSLPGCGRPILAVDPGPDQSRLDLRIAAAFTQAQLDPAGGKGLRLLAGWIFILGERGLHIAEELDPSLRGPVLLALLPPGPGLVAKVFLHDIRAILHLNHLDDFLEQGGVGRLAGLDHLFRILDGADGAVEELSFFFQHSALHAQGLGQLERVFSVQQKPDLPQGKAQELERYDLFQPLEIAQGVDAITGRGPPGLKQAQLVIMMQCPDCDPGHLSELLYLVQLAHRSLS